MRAGAALLAKVPPLELSATQRRRIRARIDAVAEPRGLRWLRPAFALPVLLVVGAAGANIGQRWFKPVSPQHVVEPTQVIAPKPAPHEAAPAPAPRAVEDLATESELEAAKPNAVPVPRASQSGPGASLMMEALQARRAGDTARAQQLTAEYQKKYPNGALKEEALAIAFESAAARNDPGATRLAQKYLASFPHGRFRKQAEQVLSNQR
jgi:TolA-binding protein